MRSVLIFVSMMCSAFAMNAEQIEFVYASKHTGNIDIVKTESGGQELGIETGSEGYAKAVLYLKKPIDMKGKAIRFKIKCQTPEKLGALSVECFNRRQDAPFWRFNSAFGLPQYGRGGKGCKEIMVKLVPDSTASLPFTDDPKQKPELMDRLTVSVAVWYPGSAAEVRITDLEVYDNKNSYPPHADWADKPVQGVHHPIGPVNTATIKIAKENIAKYDWGKKAFNRIKAIANSYCAKSDEWMKLHYREADALNPYRVPCPHCKCPTQFSFVFGADKDFKTITCRNCKTVFPNKNYPEDKFIEIKSLHGKSKKIPYYEGEFKGNKKFRYYLTLAINFFKFTGATNSMDTLGQAWLLTKDKKYAEGARRLLLRLAEVYPHWSPRSVHHNNIIFHDKAFGRGRSADWLIRGEVSELLPAMLAYTQTYNSGVYSDADKVKIENGIVRELQHGLYAMPPLAEGLGELLNYSAKYICDGILGETEKVHKVLKGPESLEASLNLVVYRDGLMHHTFSYIDNYIHRIKVTVNTVKGYSDPASYKGADRIDNFDPFKSYPALSRVFYNAAYAMLPTGTLPPVNSTKFYQTVKQDNLYYMREKYPTQTNIELFNYFANKRALKHDLFEPAGENLTIPKNPKFPEVLKHSKVFAGFKMLIARRPESAQESALVFLYNPMKAYSGNSHIHRSMLGYLFVDHKKETVTDLGYMGGASPHYYWLYNQLAHNVVLVDGKEQAWKAYAIPCLFADKTKIMALRFTAPFAYPNVTDYTRMMFNIPLDGGKRQYLVDFFSVKGGKEHIYPFHSDVKGMMIPTEFDLKPGTIKDIGPSIWTGKKFISDVKTAPMKAGTHKFSWKAAGADDIVTNQFFMNSKAGTLVTAEGPGMRLGSKEDYKKNIKIRLALPKLAGPNNVFASVIESVKGDKQFVKSAELLKTAGREATAVKVVTTEGVDIIVYACRGIGDVTLPAYPEFSMSAIAGVVRLDTAGKVKSIWTEDGRVKYADNVAGVTPRVAGIIEKIEGQKIYTNLPYEETFDYKGTYLWAPSRLDNFYKLSGYSEKRNKLVLEVAPKELVRLSAGDEFTIETYAEKDF